MNLCYCFILSITTRVKLAFFITLKFFNLFHEYFSTANDQEIEPLRDFQINTLNYYFDIVIGSQQSPLASVISHQVASTTFGLKALVLTGVSSGLCTFFVVLITILALRARDKKQQAKKYEEENFETRSTSWTSSAAGTVRSLKSFKTNPVFQEDDISLNEDSISTISNGTKI